jgi:tRNA(fMet)-specific endonuclease VapC
MLLLDTNVCVEIIRGRPERTRDRFRHEVKEGTELFVSTVTCFELWYGAEKSDRPDVNRRGVETFLSGPLQVLDFNEGDSRIAGSIRTTLELQGKMIGPFDTLVAGQALRHNLTIVTANIREFSRVKGLRIENWTK